MIYFYRSDDHAPGEAAKQEVITKDVINSHKWEEIDKFSVNYRNELQCKCGMTIAQYSDMKIIFKHNQPMDKARCPYSEEDHLVAEVLL